MYIERGKWGCEERRDGEYYIHTPGWSLKRSRFIALIDME